MAADPASTGATMGSSGGDDGTSPGTPEERINSLAALAKQADAVFELRQYDDCLELLAKVRQQKEDDSKVQHNVSIARYLQRGCRNPENVLKTLGEIKSKIEESKRSKDEDEYDEYDEEYDTSLLSYNEAVVYYHLKQYATSTTILEELFSNVEPIEEGLAIKICFLLLDNYITLNQPEKAAKPVEFLDKLATQIENEMASKDVNDDVSAFFQQAGQKASSLACPKTITVKDFQMQLHLYRAKVHLLNSSFRNSKREIKAALNANSNNAEAAVLKANLEYLKANYRKSLKLLQTAYSTVQEEEKKKQAKGQASGGSVSSVRGGGSKVPDMAPLVQNNIACIHYSMQNYNAALWYLSCALKSAHAIAQARLAEEGFEEDGAASVFTFSTDRKSQILYNTGMQLLFTGKPSIAFQCFQEASSLFYSSPRLWLRLAECCVARHAMQEREKREQSSGDPLVASTVGRGNHRKILLPVSTGLTSPALSAPGDMDGVDGDGEESPVPTPPPETDPPPPGAHETISLEYGMHCARNALFFAAPPPPPPSAVAPAVAATPDKAPAQASGGAAANSTRAAPKGIGATAKEPAPTAESVARAAELEAERRRVQVAALLNLSYLALCVSSPELALSYAQELVAVPDVERSPKLQGHMYAAEALCILNRPQEAAQHVSPTTVGDLLSPQQQAVPRAAPSAESEEHHVVVNHPVHLYCSDSGEHDPATARCHLYVNMASVFITQNELAKAEKCCQQALFAAPDDMHALQLHVYLELRMGKVEGALQALKTSRASPGQLGGAQGGSGRKGS